MTVPDDDGAGPSSSPDRPPTPELLASALSAAFAHAQEAVLVIGSSSREIVACNEAAERMFGYEHAELLGRDTAILHVDRESFLEFERRSEPVLAREGVFRTRYRMRRRDGSVFETLHTVTLLKRSAGIAGGAVSLVRDVSEVAALRSALERSEQRLLLAQRRVLAGQVANALVHDFNNALTIVQGNVDQLLEAGLEGRQRRAAELVLEAVEDARAISSRLASLQRTEAPGQKEGVDLSAEIRRSEALLRSLFPKDVSLALHLAEEPQRIALGPTETRQLLVNLALNARDAMPGRGRVELGTEALALGERDPRRPASLAPGRYVRLRFSDDGSGIPEESRSYVFDDFFTTKGERGTGLGLAAVRAIVVHCGGEVAVESELGRGTTFRLYLPAPPEPDGGPG